MKCSIFDHHTHFGSLMASGVVTRTQMWWLPVVHSMGRNQRIVRSGIKVFTCDVVFIKSEHNTLDGWALCNLNSHDPNGNLVCLSSCLCPKENCKGYNTMFDKVMTTVLTEQDHDTERNFGEYLNSADCLLLSDSSELYMSSVLCL